MPKNEKIDWYQLTPEETFKKVNSSTKGLTDEEASKRLEEYGYNVLETKKVSPLIRLLRQFNNPLIYLLIFVAIFTGFLGEWVDTIVILAVVIINTSVGFIQEGKAESSIEALEKMMIPECTVIRSDNKKMIDAHNLAIGDVVILQSGSQVPADIRLFRTKDLYIDEAALTGESVPDEKDTEAIDISGLPPADQNSMAFGGTFVTQGLAEGVVVATGEYTEMGKIAEIIKETQEIVTPLIRKMEEFTKVIVIAILTVALINFVLSALFGFGLLFAFLASASLVVAAIPEGLPAVLTITLAFGVKNMAQRNALIRKLPSVETLGRVTVICSDKTGTLTKNQMTTVKIYCGGKTYEVTGSGYETHGDILAEGKPISIEDEKKELKYTLKAGLLCNNASLVEENGINVLGDPTEGALIVAAAKAEHIEKGTRLDEIPFESEKKYMATLHQLIDENIIYVKGSPETIVEYSKNQMINNEIEDLEADEILENANKMGKEALRVLGFAYKIVDEHKTDLNTEDIEGLTFLGLQGLIDPPREEVQDAVEQSRSAGIKTVMITGDHAKTAKAIAKQLGIISSGERVITGRELSQMSDEELYEIVDQVSVYARVSPEHKYHITTQLQKKGQIVGVTGDGVNDAPALKAADIGIAMGITGTDVSKEASDMVLADDNFASIVKAVEEGRFIFDNIRKIILYVLAANGGQSLIILGALILAPFIPLFLFRLPLEPVQILWINLFDSIFLALPLIKEPKEAKLLDKPPRDPDEKIVNWQFIRKVGLVSLVMAGAGLSIYYLYAIPALGNPVNEFLLAQAQTAAFATVIMVHIFYLITAKSLKDSIFKIDLLANKWSLLGIGITILSVLMISYIPIFQVIFRTAPIPLEWWITIILFAVPGLIVIEIEKLLARRLGWS